MEVGRKIDAVRLGAGKTRLWIRDRGEGGGGREGRRGKEGKAEGERRRKK